MGNFLSGFVENWRTFVGEKDCRIVILGLDAAGKTSLLYKLKLDEDVCTIPTLGFNVESIQYKKVKMECWDIGGQDRLRPLWMHYYKNSDAVIFVVDSNDTDRMQEAKDVLASVMNDKELENVLLLVYANKQDLPNAKTSTDMIPLLGLKDIKQEWYIQPCCCKTGDGLFEGLDWMCKKI